MSRDLFNDVTSTTLRKTLDATVLRQKAIASNIANVETPGYKRAAVSFEGELKRVLDRSRGPQALDAVKSLQPIRQTDTQSPARPDGNNVNIDAEIADLNKTVLLNRAATTLLQIRGNMMKSAVEAKR